MTCIRVVLYTEIQRFVGDLYTDPLCSALKIFYSSQSQRCMSSCDGRLGEHSEFIISYIFLTAR